MSTTYHRAPAWSYQQAIKRFSAPQVASRYPSAYRAHHWRDQREKQCVLKALDSIPAGSHVLDLPCGTGRLTRLLIDCGFRVTGADVSQAMLVNARSNIASAPRPRNADAFPPVDFDLCDVMHTGYADGQFDAVLCNRLFHHFTESDTRWKALTELRRITRGPVIISFFNTFAVDAVYRKMGHILRRKPPRDRIPIPYATFHNELRAAGFRVFKRIAVCWGISPQWYVVAFRDDAERAHDPETQGHRCR